jgi:hypothetical protein
MNSTKKLDVLMDVMREVRQGWMRRSKKSV